jgi:hypothetical protein
MCLDVNSKNNYENCNTNLHLSYQTMQVIINTRMINHFTYCSDRISFKEFNLNAVLR